MKRFILAVLIIVLVSLISAPVNADSGKGDLSSFNMVANPSKTQLGGHNVGDKIIFGKNLVGTLQGIDASTGKGIFTATIDAPKYLDDLKTQIATNWIQQGNAFYRLRNNLFTATVKGNQTTVNYSGDSMTWQPDLYVGNQLYTPTDGYLISDPLNSNYGANTIQWNYPAGITRYLRQIEGVLMDYYTVNYVPSGDIVIRDHTVKTGNFNSDRGAWAIDASGKAIPITVDINGGKIVALTDLKNAVYPITIDPTSTYTTSASDGYNEYSSSTVYATTHDATTASTTYAANTISAMGQTTSYVLFRGYVYFDTSSLPDTATVTAGTLSLYGQGDYSCN